MLVRHIEVKEKHCPYFPVSKVCGFEHSALIVSDLLGIWMKMGDVTGLPGNSPYIPLLCEQKRKEPKSSVFQRQKKINVLGSRSL